MNKRLVGRWGEAKAAEYLRGKGYEIVGLNYYTRFGEIDLIASGDGYIVFVEVKLRKDDKIARPGAFVTGAKIRRLRSTAELWLASNETGLQPRFDVIEITAPEGAADGSVYSLPESSRTSRSPQSVIMSRESFDSGSP